MTPRLHLLAVIMGSAVLGHAQFTDMGTVDGRFFATHSLVGAGTKLIGQSYTEARILNLDYSPYLIIPYPAPPVDFTYSSVPIMVLESTFDNDPSTVEVLVSLIGPAGAVATRVIRQDGSILFELVGYGISGINSPVDLISSAAVFNATDGFTYLQLCTPPQSSVTTRLYRLPGTLPCLECAGSGMAIQSPEPGGSESALWVFPNPASGMITVSCDFPDGLVSGTVQILAPDGKVVRQLPIRSGVAVQADLHGLAAGQYLFKVYAGDVFRSSRTVSWTP